MILPFDDAVLIVHESFESADYFGDMISTPPLIHPRLFAIRAFLRAFLMNS